MARRAASNFYYCFHLLPSEKRRAMCALYAYLRETDDLGDSPRPLDERRAALANWRSEVEAALDGRPRGPILPALADTAQKFRIPRQYLLDVLDGVQMDLDERTYETFAELEQYCYRVASVVGLSCIHIWGFSSDEAVAPAVQCGLAFQLTNILRDLDEDARRGRVYLPLEDLKRFDYRAEDLRNRVRDDRFRELVRFEVARAEEFYRGAAALQNYLHPQGRRIYGAMVDTYHQLLAEIRRRDGDLFDERVRIGKWRKLRIALRWTLSRPSLPSMAAPHIKPVEGARQR
jgi:phytoene synthase